MSERKSGCIGTLVKLFGLCILLSILAAVFVGRHEPKPEQAVATPRPATTPAPPRPAVNPSRPAASPSVAVFDINTVKTAELPRQVTLKSSEEFPGPNGVGRVTAPAGATVALLSRSGEMLRLQFVDGQKDVPYTKTSLAADVQVSRDRASQIARRQAEQVRKGQEADAQAKKAAEQARIDAGIKTTVGGYFASPSEDLVAQASAYAAENDSAALNKLLATGAVIQLKGGLDVQIVDSHIFKGLVKIRPRGEIIELWTNTEAVK